MNSYKMIADGYSCLGDNIQELKYRNKYTKINDSLTLIRKSKFQISSDLVAQNHSKPAKFNSGLIIMALAALLMIIIFSVIKYNKRKDKPNHSTLKEEHEEQEQKEEIIINEKEAILSREEIIDLAKNNSNQFFYKFKERYPEFVANLIKRKPDIATSELIFCAYLKLKFSTKDIATFTFVTPKAVQNRKNRIRKKLDISSDADIYLWFDEF